MFKTLNFCKSEAVLIISFVLALISSFIVPLDAGYIDPQPLPVANDVALMLSGQIPSRFHGG